FWQCDADTVGTPMMAADAELAAMLADCMEAVGISRGDYVVRLNNRKVLNGVLERIGVLNADDPQTEVKRLTILRAIDKLDRLGPEGVRLLLGPGRKDESGDFTEGAKLSAEQTDMVMAFTDAGGGGREKVMARLAELVANSPAGREGIEELERIAEVLDALGYADERVTFDPSIVRGLGYYTGPVFEADLTFEIEDEKGRPVRFGSVASGGRYDDLVKRFKGVEVPATGCSIGVSRLLSALRVLGRVSERHTRGPVVVLVMEKGRLPGYARMAQELRAAGVRAEVYLGGGGMKAQLKYADKRGAPVAIIQGEDERNRGEVTLKDLILGAQMAAAIADNRTWREEQPAQISVPAESLVKGVREILARHA
ncbi:MAG: histidine--tRNA ligase, partial [Alphaproteobacteria bacterium]